MNILDLQTIPDPPELEKRCMAIAMLDAVIAPEYEERTYHFNNHWDDEGSRMASMRTNKGDEYFILFLRNGEAAIIGWDHESPRNKNVLNGLPSLFEAPIRADRAFDAEFTSFALWNAGDGWKRNPSLTAATLAGDGSSELLEVVLGGVDEYIAYTNDLYEIEIPREPVERFFNLEPLTDELMASLNPKETIEEIEEIQELGYPGTEKYNSAEDDDDE